MTTSSKPGIGHNSIQYRPFGVKNSPLWAQAERDMARRERRRLVRSGVILPASMMKPQLLVKDADGKWVPEVKVYER